MCTIFKVKVRNWDKHNPRVNAKKWSWVKLQLDFFTDADVFDLSAPAKLAFVYLLCEQARHNGAELKVNPKLASQLVGISEEDFVLCLQDLAGRKLIEVSNLEQREVSKVSFSFESDEKRNLKKLDETFLVSSLEEEEEEEEEKIGSNPNPSPSGSPPHPEACGLGSAIRGDSGEESSPQGGSFEGGEADEASTKCIAEDYDLADLWAQYALKVSRTVKPKRIEWANTFRLMRTKDGATVQELYDLLDFVEQDFAFWRDKAVSPPSLRTRSKNGKLKIENALDAMHRAQEASQPKRHDPYADMRDLSIVSGGE